MEKYHIIIDSREASSAKGILNGLKKYEDVEVIIENLGQSVDYAINGKDGYHIIQRKTVWEVPRTNALFEDLICMKSIENAKPYLLLEGNLGLLSKDWGFKKGHWRPEPIIGIMESVILDYNVPIIPSPSQLWTTKWLYQRAKRLNATEEKTEHVQLREAKPKELTPREKAIYVISGFEGIGKVRATEILNRCGTLRNFVINAETLRDMPYIGNVITKKIIPILDAQA